jgi:hypothetical protein
MNRQLMYSRVNQDSSNQELLISELHLVFLLCTLVVSTHFLGKLKWPSIDLLWRLCGAIFLFFELITEAYPSS